MVMDNMLIQLIRIYYLPQETCIFTSKYGVALFLHVQRVGFQGQGTNSTPVSTLTCKAIGVLEKSLT